MPEHLRALIVVLALSGLSWWLLMPVATRIVPVSTARTWRFLWLGVTLLAFLSGHFAIYAAALALLLLTRRFAPPAALSAWCLLLLAVPAASTQVPGLGLINYLVDMNHPQWLTLLLLLPAAVALLPQKGALRFGATTADRWLLAYVLLVAVLQLREANLTSTLRGTYYLAVGAVLPYFVASRALRDIADFRQVLLAFVMAAAVLGTLAVFETLRHWNLYAAVTNALDIRWGLSGYLAREGMQRAAGSTGQPLVLGYCMAVALGAWLYLRSIPALHQRIQWPLWLMLGGLLAALSRGPWVGAVVTVTVFIATGPRALRNILLLTAGGALALGALALVGPGRRVLDFLPFVGKVDEFNVTYRQDLLTNAIAVIERNFWLGSVNYLDAPEMQRMIQGQGIIDLVNTYVGVALSHGMVGLALFIGFFATLLWEVWRVQLHLPHDDDRRMLGRALLAVMASIVVMISAISSILLVPTVYWLMGGLCVAYLQMMKNTAKSAKEAPL